MKNNASAISNSNCLNKKQRKTSSRKTLSNRIFEIDFLRGVVIIGMIVDHFIGNFYWLFPHVFNWSQYMANGALKALYDFAVAYWLSPARHLIRFIGIALLTVLTGISSRFSKNNLKRSLLIIIAGLVFTLFTYLMSVFIPGFDLSISGTLFTLGMCIFTLWFSKWLYGEISFKYRQHKYIKAMKSGDESILDEPFPKYDKNPKNFKWLALSLFIILTIVSIFLCLYSPYEVHESWKGVYIDPTIHAILRYCRDEMLMARVDDLSFVNSFKIIFGINALKTNGDYLAYLPFVSFVFLGSFIGETIYKDKESIFRFIVTPYIGGLYDNVSSEYTKRLNLNLRKAFVPVVFSGIHTIAIYFSHEIVIGLVGAICILCSGVAFNI